jgi:hypothetical protein
MAISSLSHPRPERRQETARALGLPGDQKQDFAAATTRATSGTLAHSSALL